ncbi:MAG: hypothetical protein QE274_02760 [Verrucomicrobiaceae bacterium]|nr:hypothetical protein [Verrucomicrobiaceae bacterium]
MKIALLFLSAVFLVWLFYNKSCTSIQNRAQISHQNHEVKKLTGEAPIKVMATHNPELVQTLIETSSYPDLLSFVQNAYSESKSDENNGAAQYVYFLALDQASLDKKIPLAIDFSLSQSDFVLKQLGARAILFAVIKGAAPDSALRQKAVTKLKDELSKVSEQGRDTFEFARSAALALTILGDDSGLDVLLTDQQTVSNYSQKDGWNPTSDAALFQTLKSQYKQRAISPNNANPDIDRTWEATYELCRLRRIKGKEIKPLKPLVKLEQLLPR